MKKIWFRLLSVVLVMGLLTGCGAAQEPPVDQQINEFDFDFDFEFETLPTVGIKDWDDFDDPTTAPTDDLASADGYDLEYGTVVSSDNDQLRYVMIYNPDVYQASAYYNPTRTTGSIASQVEVDLDKGGLTELPQYMGIAQDQLNDLPITDPREGDKAGHMAPVYKVGEEKIFYCANATDVNADRIARTFTCRYAGTYCNIWVADVTLSDTIVNGYGKEFDTYIYESVVNAFGQPRFGGKVQLLYYPLQDGLGGFFSLWDLYAYNEVTTDEVINYGLNTDHDIVHVNGYYADYNNYPGLKLFMNSVMAHEFQHLICATNGFENSTYTFCDSWFNEAMSGYIEELLYPGVKESSSGHLSAFYGSESIQGGQSLYNFDNVDGDIGVYGSVYLYSTYLASIAGEDVFSNFHRNWRYPYDMELNVPTALANSVPASTYGAVDALVPYPGAIQFESPEEKWMSKLTLQFYLELLDKDDTDPLSFQPVDRTDLLYNQINPANIEGGGRVILALSGDRYVIPDDADTGLIYVGLNKDFEVVTDLIYH